MKLFLLFLFPFILFSCEKEAVPEKNQAPVAEDPKRNGDEGQEEEVEEDQDSNSISYLALGDSYTIGEGVAENQRWPVLLVQKLEEANIDVEKLEIIARTGWTTGKLQEAINSKDFDESFDLVSLLIGVNNQYQGRSLEEFKKEFFELLKTATELAGGRKENVFVLSIPDYSVTPFAQGSKTKKIAEEIRAFNSAKEEIAKQYGVGFFNITPISQKAKDDPELLAPDGLHPSGKMYSQWVELILPEIVQMARNL